MQYALLIYETSADFARREQAGDAAPYFGAWRAYYKAVVEAGIYAGVKPLDASETATTVRLRDGKPLVQDGPYASSKEQLAASCCSSHRRSMQPWNGRLPRLRIWCRGNDRSLQNSYGALKVKTRVMSSRTAPSRQPRVNHTGVWSRCLRRDHDLAGRKTRSPTHCSRH